MRSVSAATILRSCASASLPPFSPAATTTSPVGREGDRLLGDARSPSGLSAAWTACAFAATSSVSRVRCASSSALVVREDGAQLVATGA